MTRYDEIRYLIAANSDVVNFADFGDGTPEEWIRCAEDSLGFQLPESYKWWSRNYGGGEIGGEEIFSIFGPNAERIACADIVRMFYVDPTNPARIPICHSDVDGAFCFDRNEVSSESEFAVVSEGTGRVYARDFLEFLEKRIAAFQSSREARRP